MDTPRIIPLRIGFTAPVLIDNGENAILVDAGVKGKITDFLQQFGQHGIDPGRIRLIVLTHTHYDHTGNLAELKALTGAKVVVNLREAEWLKTGSTPIPKGTFLWSKIIVGLGKLLKPGYASSQPFVADMLVDREFDLSPWGFDAKIVHTPGHTIGSQSVIAGNTLIAGDCFFNIKRLPVFPPFADDPRTLLETWRNLLDREIEYIYPAHGPVIPIARARDAYHKMVKRFG